MDLESGIGGRPMPVVLFLCVCVLLLLVEAIILCEWGLEWAIVAVEVLLVAVLEFWCSGDDCRGNGNDE